MLHVCFNSLKTILEAKKAEKVKKNQNNKNKY